MKDVQGGVAPALRFPDFADPLNSVKLGDVATFSKGKGISKSDIDAEGTLPCIRYGELYTVYDTVIDEAVSRTNVSKSALTLSKGDDVLVPASGEDAKDIATAVVIKAEGVAIGGDLNIIRSKNDGAFLAAYLSGRKRLTLAAMAQGNSVVHLYSRQLKSLDVHLPSVAEQRKIAAFLSAVDTKIACLARKKVLLEDYKKGCMQQIFSQKLRFKDEGGCDFPDWEVKRLGEVAKRSTVKNTNLEYMRVLTNSAVQGVVDQGDYFDKDIANEENLAGYYVLKKGDFVYNPRISANAPVGPIKRNELGDGVMSPLYTVFRFSQKDTTFYSVYFATKSWHSYMRSVANYGARHDRMAISSADLMNMPLPHPHPGEQRKIADFLSALDTKIDLIGQELTHARSFKQGLLQQMFV
jgi:type I restriction enzyme S subunit